MIKLTEKLCIRVDMHCYTLCNAKTVKTGKRTGETDYEVLGYFGNIEGAIDGALKWSIKEALTGDEVIELREAVKIITEKNREFTELLNSILKEKEI